MTRDDIFIGCRDFNDRWAAQHRFFQEIRDLASDGVRVFRSYFPNPKHASHYLHGHLIELCLVNFLDSIATDKTTWVVRWLTGPSAGKASLAHSTEFRPIHPLQALALVGIDA